MVIQVARSVIRQAVRTAAVRTLVALMLLGLVVSLYPGIFGGSEDARSLLDGLLAAPTLTAMAICAYLPALRSDQLRASRALQTQLVAAGAEARWAVGLWLGSWVGGLCCMATGWVLALVLRPETLMHPGSWQVGLAAAGSLSLLSALSLALSCIVSKTYTLVAVAGLWILAASPLVGDMTTSNFALPALLPISIILPPLVIFSTTSHITRDVVQTSSYWTQAALAATTTGACLSASIGIMRLRRG